MHELRRRIGVRRLGVLASGWFAGQLVIGCSTILGIEPLQELRGAGGHAGEVAESRSEAGTGGRAGKSGAAARDVEGSGDAGAGAQAGDSGTAGTAGAHESNAARGGAGAPQSRAGSGGHSAHGGAAGRADSAGAAGVAVAGAGGGPGSPGVLSTVRGTVVDTRGRPVVDAQVQIGEHTTVTDALGAFSVDAVPETYDVGLLLVATVSAKPLRNAWLFEGLRRRDPTLQIYPGPGARFTELLVHTAAGESTPLPAGQELYVAFGSPDTDFAAAAIQSNAGLPSPYWSGPEQTSGAVHALLVNNTVVDGAPTEILAYDTQPVTVTSGPGVVDVLVSLAGPPVTFGVVSGRVTSHGGSRANWFSLRWPDGTALTTGLSTTGPGDQFSLIVPDIADASTAVVAMEGSIKNPPYAVGFIDGVVAGSSNYSIAIPEIPQSVAPAQGKSGVDATTSFEWLAPGPVCVLHLIAKETYDEFYLVTGKQTGHLPGSGRVPYVAPANAQFIWRVEWHGDQASSITSVDDAAGPTGFLSAFWEDRLHGPKRGPGSYAVSEDRTFTTAP